MSGKARFPRWALVRFIEEYNALCAEQHDCAIEAFAVRLGWSTDLTRQVAWFLVGLGLIDTDAGFSQEITVIEWR